MKKFNFILFAGALLSLAGFQLQSADAEQAQKASSVVSEEVAVKKQNKDVAVVEKAEAAAPAATAAAVSTEKKADTQKAAPASAVQKK